LWENLVLGSRSNIDNHPRLLVPKPYVEIIH
jgi:hypothetical protein